MTQSDFRALCAELLDEIPHESSLTRMARAALAEPRIIRTDRDEAGPYVLAADGPAVPEGREPASVTGNPSDADALAARPLLERVAAIGDCIGASTVGEIMAISDRAAAWLTANPPGNPIAIKPRNCPMPGACSCVQPAPPAEGEVADGDDWFTVAMVAQDMRSRGLAEQVAGDELLKMANRNRIADSLERRPPTPVPAAIETIYEFCVYDENYIDQAGGTAPTYAQALSEGRHYLAQYQQDGPHTLELRRIERLPLPAGEAKE